MNFYPTVLRVLPFRGCLPCWLLPLLPLLHPGSFVVQMIKSLSQLRGSCAGSWSNSARRQIACRPTQGAYRCELPSLQRLLPTPHLGQCPGQHRYVTSVQAEDILLYLTWTQQVRAGSAEMPRLHSYGAW